MIENLAEKARNNPELATKIYDYSMSAADHYFNHRCYQVLRQKKHKLDDSIDMRFNSTQNNNDRVQNAWRSNIAIPMVREAFLARRAITSSAFSTPPLVSLIPDGYTARENALNMNDLLQTNLRVSDFQQRTLSRVIDSCSRYGASVVYSYFDTQKKLVKRTVPKYINDQIVGYESITDEKQKNGVLTDIIHILNYFQEPDQPNPELSRYQGYIDRGPSYEIQNDAEGLPDVYIMENVAKLLKQANQGGCEDTNYYNHSNDSRNTKESHHKDVDVYKMYTKLNIKGNEDDDTTYYLEFSNGFLIRIQENPHDEDLIPIDIYCFDKRPEYWWGTTDAENVVPMENYLQMIFSLYADSTIQELQRFIFFDNSSGINPAAINQAAKNGGFIPFNKKPNQKLNEIFYQYQFPGVATGNLNYIASEIKEQAQRVRPQADFAMQPNQGGLQNKTATAANIMGNQANTQESYYLRQFSYGLKNNMKTHTILLKQFTSNIFWVRPNLSGDPVQLAKYKVLGEFSPVVRTSITQNQATQSQKLLNFITGVMNFRGGGDPAWLNFNLPSLIKDYTKTIFPDSDVNEMYPEMQPQQQIPMGGQPPQLGAPAPQPQQGAVQNVA